MGAAFRRLEKALWRARSYDQWRQVAAEIDEYNGASRWREIDSSSQYDYISIRHRLDHLRALRARHDYRGLLFALSEGIHGNMGGMGKSGLYQRSLLGTKTLITDYIDEIADALELLAQQPVEGVSSSDKLEFFRRADHCFGRSALLMSGSGTLLYFHAGVVKAMAEQGLMPSILSGASGGSVVGALACSYGDAELTGLLDPEHVYASIAGALGDTAPRGLGRLRLLRFGEIERMIEALIPDLTFQQSLERSGRLMNVSIAPAETHQTSRLLNATTSPHVLLRSALFASVSVPGLYQPVALQARASDGLPTAYLPTRRWVDGSVSEDLPIQRLARLYGVNHHIVSQTNPAVLPFVVDGQRRRSAGAIVGGATRRTAREWLNAGAALMDRPLSRRTTLSQAANLLLSLVNQDYVGDINVMPRNRVPHPFKILHHLREKDIRRMMREGERATWRRMEMIRVQTRISRLLQDILQRLEPPAAQPLQGETRRAA